MEDFEFHKFGKIPRLSRDVVVTEKIDGTNGQILIKKVWDHSTPPTKHPDEVKLKLVNEYPGVFFVDFGKYGMPGGYAPGDVFAIMAGSRSRWLTDKEDNYGFRKWCFDNAMDLVDVIGEGRHYGEWWGSGINRNYGLKNGERRFSLFNSGKWTPEYLVSSPLAFELDVVPVLYEGPFETEKIEWVLEELRKSGSFVRPGFMNPEGVIIYHVQGNLYFKKTIHGDEKPKGNG